MALEPGTIKKKPVQQMRVAPKPTQPTAVPTSQGSDTSSIDAEMQSLKDRLQGGGLSFGEVKEIEQRGQFLENEKKRMGVQDKRRNERLAEEKQFLEQDLQAGRERGQELFGEGSLGGRAQADIQTDLDDILARRRTNLMGMSAPEQSALRSAAFDRIGAEQMGAHRQLAGLQAQAGVRGGLAGSQQASLANEGQRQRAGIERDLFLADLERRQAALGEFEGTVEKGQQARERELFGQLGTEFGMAQLGLQGRGGVRQEIVGEEMARAGREAAFKNQGKK